MDCGPACLQMVAKYYGKNFSIEFLRRATEINKDGVSLLGISEAAENLGFRSRGVELSYEQLKNDANLPAILHWGQNHFVVLPPQKFQKRTILIADPKNDIINIYVRDFKTHWLQSVDNGQETGIALLLEPSGAFYSQKEDTEKNKLGFRVLYSYLLKYKRYLAQVIIGLIVGSILQLILPFLTQGIVDVGIEGHNLKFIYLVCIAQFVLILSRTLVDFIRNRILFYISTHINISILSDFWIKMMRLPLSFFDIKRSGDTMQSINDHQRIEKFLTSTTLDSIFSLFNLILFSFIILFYNKSVYFIFFSGSILYVLWIRIFLKDRRKG